MKIEWKEDVRLEVVRGMHDDATPTISRRYFRKGEWTEIKDFRYHPESGKFDLDLNKDESIFGVSEGLFYFVKGD